MLWNIFTTTKLCDNLQDLDEEQQHIINNHHFAENDCIFKKAGKALFLGTTIIYASYRIM